MLLVFLQPSTRRLHFFLTNPGGALKCSQTATDSCFFFVLFTCYAFFRVDLPVSRHCVYFWTFFFVLNFSLLLISFNGFFFAGQNIFPLIFTTFFFLLDCCWFYATANCVGGFETYGKNSKFTKLCSFWLFT